MDDLLPTRSPVRPANDGELPPLCARLAAMDPWRHLEIPAHRLENSARNDPFRRTLIATAGEEIAGCVSFRPSQSNDHLLRLGAGDILARRYAVKSCSASATCPDGAYVNLLAVFPGHQGKGVGQLLLKEAENAAREAGVDRLFLCVSGFNSAARTFYERQGYTQIGVLENCIRPGNNEHLMLKILASTLRA